MKNKYELKCCPSCEDKRIKIILGEKGLWECSCGWKGSSPLTQYVSYKEYIEFAEGILE